MGMLIGLMVPPSKALLDQPLKPSPTLGVPLTASPEVPFPLPLKALSLNSLLTSTPSLVWLLVLDSPATTLLRIASTSATRSQTLPLVLKMVTGHKPVKPLVESSGTLLRSETPPRNKLMLALIEV